MTNPIEFEQDSYETLRRRWWGRFQPISTSAEKQIRSILKDGAVSAQRDISALSSKSTWSAGVRSAQLKLVLDQVASQLKTTFGDITPIIREKSREAAGAASDGFSDTDRAYLTEAFGETGLVSNYLRIERNSAMQQVQNAIASLTKSDMPLSRRVYRTEAVSRGWVKRDVTIGILKGDSAQAIAATVRKHINPDVPGGVSYAALRLARTELNNAFHATAIATALDRPWVDNMAWNLSSQHEIDTLNPEICEKYSLQIWEVNKVPPKPHPQCRCFVTPILESFDVFLRHLTSGQYRDWMENAA